MTDCCNLIVLWMVIASLALNIHSQESPQSECQVWGDPHLLMFGVDPTQENFRMGYWCRAAGRMTVLKNEYIEFYIDVTAEPFYNERYEIKFLADRQVICTITPERSACSDIRLSTNKIANALDIEYTDADQLSVIVNSHLVNSRTVYNIIITQSYDLIRKSTGLCVIKPTNCRLESAIKPFGRRMKRVADRDLAEKVCNEYMKEANTLAKDLLGNPGNNMVEHARAACVSDVALTGNVEWGHSAIEYVMMNALKQLKLKRDQRREKLKTVIPAISRAAATVKERVTGSSTPKPYDGACARNPCQNNQPCYNTGETYYCYCETLYTGKNCETRLT